VPRLIGQNGGHGQLTWLVRLRLEEPGKVDFVDQAGEGLGFELGTAQSFLGPHHEDLVLTDKRVSCSRSKFRIMWQTSRRIGDLFPTFYRYLPFGITIVGR
jgi:hypothetical protein